MIFAFCLLRNDIACHRRLYKRQANVAGYFRKRTIVAHVLLAAWKSLSGSPVKGLRASSPQPNTAQRSTYFLTLPYRWAVPTTAIVSLLHWLVSQMFFFARVDVDGLTTEPPGGSLPVERLKIQAPGASRNLILSFIQLFHTHLQTFVFSLFTLFLLCLYTKIYFS